MQSHHFLRIAPDAHASWGGAARSSWTATWRGDRVVAEVELELCLRTVIASVDDDGPKKLGQHRCFLTTVAHVGQHLCVEGLARKESIGRPKHDVKVDGAPSAGRRK